MINKTANIMIRVSERDKETIRARAEELQMSMSEYICFLVRLDVEKSKEKRS